MSTITYLYSFFICLIDLSLNNVNGHLPKVQIHSPFKVVNGNSPELNFINKTLKCDESPKSEIQECALSCLKREADTSRMPWIYCVFLQRKQMHKVFAV